MFSGIHINGQIRIFSQILETGLYSYAIFTCSDFTLVLKLFSLGQTIMIFKYFKTDLRDLFEFLNQLINNKPPGR
jgi:hypothetical protein